MLSREAHFADHDIEERTEQLMRDGMRAEEATRAARRAFGNRTLFEERSREV
jgi:hypothetical protein